MTKREFKAVNILKRQTNHHDKFFKSLYSHPEFALELFKLIFSKEEFEAFNWKNLKVEKDTFPEGRRADLIFSVPLKGTPGTRVKIFILLEHKSKYDRRLFQQLFRYQTLLIEKSFNEKGHPMPVISVVFYHGKKPWQWKLSFQEAFLGENFEKIPVLSRKSMLNFQIRLLDTQDPKLERVFKDSSIKSRGALYLLREVWFSKADSAFLNRVFDLFKDILKKPDDLMLSILDYLVAGYKVNQGLWQKAEARAVEQGILKKGGYMNIREHIKEEGRRKGWQEGQQESTKAIVLKMLQKKTDISFISEVTGFSKKEIEKLKNNGR